MGEKRGNITIDFDLTIAFDLKLYFADYDVIFGLVHNRSFIQVIKIRSLT